MHRKRTDGGAAPMPLATRGAAFGRGGLGGRRRGRGREGDRPPEVRVGALRARRPVDRLRLGERVCRFLRPDAAPDHDARRGGARAYLNAAQLARRRGDRPPALPRDQADGRRRPPGRTRAEGLLGWRAQRKARDGRSTGSPVPPAPARPRGRGVPSQCAAPTAAAAAVPKRPSRAAAPRRRDRGALPTSACARASTRGTSAATPPRALVASENVARCVGGERGGGAACRRRGRRRLRVQTFGPPPRSSTLPSLHATQSARGRSPWQPPPVAPCIASVVGASVAAAPPRAEQDAAGVAAAAPAGRAVAVRLVRSN